MSTEEPVWVETSEALPESSQPVEFQVGERTLSGRFSGGYFKEEGGGRFPPERVERWKPSLVMPDVLYKYRDLYPQNREWVRQIIVDNKIKFSSPASFNDPFDCKVRASTGAGSGGWKRYFRKTLKGRGASRKKQLQESKRVVKEQKHQDPAVLVAITQDVQRDVNNIGVLCLSTRNDDLLMWSYYAGGHSGLCLGFLHCVGAFGLPCAFPVEYSETYPEVDFIRHDKTRSVKGTLLTKSTAWKHEREWRFVDYSGCHGIRTFDPGLLTEIIFGVKTSPSDRDEVIGWVEQSPCRPVFYEARLKQKEYGLEIVPIT